MATYSTASSWSFPDDMPGSWSQSDIDAQLHSTDDAPPTASAPQANENQQRKPRRHYPPRTCRICLEVVEPTFHAPDLDSLAPSLPASFQPAPRVTYESPSGDGGRLLRPCKCKGSQKYVHEDCLSAWRRQDPLQKRNYWQCPTCRYKYRLQRLTWSSWISSTSAQVALTAFIFVAAMFLLGFVADPIINLYLDPVSTIATAGGPTGSLIFEDEEPSWGEHFLKGLASIGLLGFAKFLLTLGPLHWFNMRGTGMAMGSRGVNGTGRDRLQQLSWIAIIVGVITFLFAVWKGVRAWARRTLEQASERVMDVPRDNDDDDVED